MQPTPYTTRYGSWILTGAVTVATASLLSATTPYLAHYLQARSEQFATAGKGSTGNIRQLDFQLASLLNPHNQHVSLALANAQLANQQPSQALKTLRAAGEGTEVNRIRLRASLETNHPEEALAAADKLASSTTDQTDLLLAALTYHLNGRGGESQVITSRLSSPEALQRLQRAQASPTNLGVELYALGLSESASRLLMKQPASLARNTILGYIYLNHRDATSLALAKDFFTAATQINPASLEARSGLITVLQALHDTEGVHVQQRLLQRLQDQQP